MVHKLSFTKISLRIGKKKALLAEIYPLADEEFRLKAYPYGLDFNERMTVSLHEKEKGGIFLTFTCSVPQKIVGTVGHYHLGFSTKKGEGKERILMCVDMNGRS